MGTTNFDTIRLGDNTIANDRLNLNNGKVQPKITADTAVTAKTADATLTGSELLTIITNTAATATITLTLPAASTMSGKPLKVQLLAAQIVRLLPASGEKIYLGGSGVASKYLNIAGVIGNYADLYCDGTAYLVTSYSGVLTKEA